MKRTDIYKKIIIFFCGFFIFGRMGLELSIVSNIMCPAPVLFLVLGLMGGGLMTVIALTVSSALRKVSLREKDNKVLRAYVGLGEKQKLFVRVFLCCMIVVNIYIIMGKVERWEPTQEQAYTNVSNSDATDYSELNILLCKDYEKESIVLAFDKSNQLWLYGFRKRIRNNETEYKYLFGIKQSIMFEYTETNVRTLTMISKMYTKSRNMSYGATYSDISNLTINGAKPDYVIEEKMGDKKVNVWFYEDLGEDFIIQKARVDI